MNKVNAIILCGGKSSRLGTDKGLLKLDGKTLVQYSIDTVKPLCNEIIICSNNPDYKKFGYPFVEDIYTNMGPIGGIHSGLNYSGTGINFILSCDMPFISSDAISYILANSDNFPAVIPIHDNKRLEPLCGVYSKSMLPLIEKQIEKKDLKLMNLISASRHSEIEFHTGLSFYHPRLFFNINDKDSLETAIQLLSKNHDYK